MSRMDRRHWPGFPGAGFLLPAIVGSTVLVAAALAGAGVVWPALFTPPVLALACFLSFRWGRSARPFARATVAGDALLTTDTALYGVLRAICPESSSAMPREWQDWVWVPLVPTSDSAALCEAAHGGLLVERVLILPDALWPEDRLLPTEAVRGWIEEQHNHGLWLVLIRATAARAISAPPADGGVIDRRLQWVRERDPATEIVTLRVSAASEAVAEATRHWGRLSERGIPYRDLLDRAEANAG